jgi:cytochrome c-type biogenesis protein CcmH
MNERFRWLLGQATAPGPSADVAPASGRPAADQLSAEQEVKAAAIARQTMSPFCPGRTLADCPSEYAAEWRRDIRQLLAEGKSPVEIQDELERRAGANLSGSPARDTSYWIPAAFALLGVGVLGAIFVRLRTAPAPRDTKAAADQEAAPHSGTTAAKPNIDDARLDAELAAEDDDR